VAGSPAVWAVLTYRFRRWAYLARMPWPLGWVFKVVGFLSSWCSHITSNIQLPPTAAIGPGLYLPHTGYIVVSTRARIGRNCTVAHGVTIGHARGGVSGKEGAPVLGDRVYVGPGAVIIGPITIGDDALIGAGAVVVKSVPPRAVVAGNPARVLSHTGSFDLVNYPGMESDPDRSASLDRIGSEDQD
jgi:serine O-acetyltransferase